MRKIKLLIVLTVLFVWATMNANAGVGDTTWVQANKVNLDYYNNFDVKVKFPDGSVKYRQVLQIFTLGEYACPAGTQYCHQWDYTITNYVMSAAGDTAELSRLITPYANTGVPRFPSTWTQQYVFDVTDYYPILKDSATIRLNYSGYSGGFTADVKFAFIEGTPVRDVIDLKHLWSNYYEYGNTANPIENRVQAYSLTMPDSAKFSELKFTITGHGADATDNCCEFSDNNLWHSYSVLVDNNEIDSCLIYRDDCGLNELYPQGGTWIYNRANWCPGALVNVNTHALPVNAGNNYTLDVNFSDYTSTGSFGGYNVNGEVFYYGKFNHTTDATLSDIISPTTNPDHFRENPIANSPTIRVRNTGSATINSILFQYNVKDSASMQYTWTGSLLPLHDTTIYLPALAALTNLVQLGATGLYQFSVQIVKVNGAPDEDNSNDKLTSSFTNAPVWPSRFVVAMKTNSEGVTGIGVNPSETSWQITDMNNNVVASRTNADVSKLYNDTVTFTPGIYKLSITDLGCDGLHWWVWDQNPGYGVTAGSFALRKANTTGNINMKGYSYSGTYRHDFGCGFTQYFCVNTLLSGVDNLSATDLIQFDLFPNPANSIVWLSANFLESNAPVELTVIDVLGKVVKHKQLTSFENYVPLDVNIEALAGGVYEFVLQKGNQRVAKRCSIVH